MSNNQNTLRQRIKGDLYLVMQKDKFHKVFNQNLQPQKNNTLKTIFLNDIKDQVPNKYKSSTLLPCKSQQSDTTNLQNKKTRRKNSQVSIVQDFINHQKQSNDQKQIQKQRYTFNFLTYPKRQQQNPQKNLSKDKREIQQKTKLLTSAQQQASNKYKNLKSFFQYVLDFKLMNIESYLPKKKQNQYRNINQILLSPRVRKSTKSLKVRFQPESAEKDLNDLFQQKNKVIKEEEDQKKQLEASQMSFVDVQVSDVSLEDQLPELRNDFSQHDQKSTTSDMKKDKKVCFDFQNKNDTSLDQINFLDVTDSNQNIGQNIYKSQSRIVSLQQLKKRIQNAQQEANNYIHHGYFCDDCKVNPIVGRRYKCVECQQYDLCQKCFKHQCKNFRSIMNKYKKQNSRQNSPKISFAHIAEISPMMKKKMSEIKEEESPSQNFSSQEGIFVSSGSQILQDEHVHIMEEVKKSRPHFQQNLQKVLKESNRCTNQYLLKSTQRNSEKPYRGISPLTPRLPRHKILNSSQVPFSKLSFSERTIPFRMTEKAERQILVSNRQKLEKIKKTNAQLKNLFK